VVRVYAWVQTHYRGKDVTHLAEILRMSTSSGSCFGLFQTQSLRTAAMHTTKPKNQAPTSLVDHGKIPNLSRAHLETSSKFERSLLARSFLSTVDSCYISDARFCALTSVRTDLHPLTDALTHGRSHCLD
jgi:hypothetical protein